jgi:hypothetical protein
LGEGLAGVDVVLFVEVFDVGVDGAVGDLEVGGDLGVGLALEEAVEDLGAAF